MQFRPAMAGNTNQNWTAFAASPFAAERNLSAIKIWPAARALFPRHRSRIIAVARKKFVLDGELVIDVGGRFSFDELQLRLHPAASRVQKLAAAHPATFIVFDLLESDTGKSLFKVPLRNVGLRWRNSPSRISNQLARSNSSPATTSLAQAKKWFEKAGGNLDGIIGKRLDAAYASGERTEMVKVKNIRTADCVVGGFRYASGSKLIGSLLLGLYDDGGLLHHVGFTSAFKTTDKRALTKKFEALRKRPGFTGNAPGGPSRWSTERSAEWEPVDPKIVVEVTYDHFTGDRFRHGTRIVRWRKDKAPRQCTLDQVAHREGRAIALL